jgi:Mrp family chromosome partitioning ATPase
VGVTSAVAGEGKTSVALHLASTIARDSFRRVCVVDLTLGVGTRHRKGDADAPEGVGPFLEDGCAPVSGLRVNGVHGFVLLPGGSAPANRGRTARSPRVAALLDTIRGLCDLVLVDLPPLTCHETPALARSVDRLIMVARAGVTPAHVTRRAINELGEERVLGVVLTRAQRPRSWKRFSR